MTTQQTNHAIPDVRGEVMSLLEKMRGAINSGAHQRMHQITDQIEMVARTYLEPAIVHPLPGVKLTQSDARILARLAQAKGGVVTKAQLMDALYFDRIGDEPEIKIVDVFVCKLRKKLQSAPFTVETAWGYGYALKELAA